MVYIDPITRRATLKLQGNKVLTGFDLLQQQVIARLLTTPETDILDPNDGGGIYDLVGMGYDPEDLSELYTDISRRVAKTQSDIINSQIGIDIPSSERLRQIEIVSLTQGDSLDTVDLRLRIENEVGRTQDVVI